MSRRSTRPFRFVSTPCRASSPHALAHRYPGDPQQVGHLLVGKGDGEQDTLRLRPAVLLGQGEQGLGDAGTEVQKAVHGQQAGQHLALAGLHLKDLQGQGGGRLHPAAEHRGRDAEEAALRYRHGPEVMAPAEHGPRLPNGHPGGDDIDGPLLPAGMAALQQDPPLQDEKHLIRGGTLLVEGGPPGKRFGVEALCEPAPVHAPGRQPGGEGKPLAQRLLPGAGFQRIHDRPPFCSRKESAGLPPFLQNRHRL